MCEIIRAADRILPYNNNTFFHFVQLLCSLKINQTVAQGLSDFMNLTGNPLIYYKTERFSSSIDCSA